MPERFGSSGILRDSNKDGQYKKLDLHFARKQGKERHVTCPRCITRKHNGISNSILVIWKAKTKPFCAMWVPDNIMAWKESTSARLWIEDACENKIVYEENDTRKRKSNDIPPKHQNKKRLRFRKRCLRNIALMSGCLGLQIRIIQTCKVSSLPCTLPA